MALFTWSSVYSVGNDEIDRQHQQLFDIANQFHLAHEMNAGGMVKQSVFNRLLDYTKTHFAYEEEVLEQVNYPDLIRHKENHIKLISLVANYGQQLQENREGVSQRIVDFLKLWLDGHICGMDRRYRSHINNMTTQQSRPVPTPPDPNK